MSEPSYGTLKYKWKHQRGDLVGSILLCSFVILLIVGWVTGLVYSVVDGNRREAEGTTYQEQRLDDLEKLLLIEAARDEPDGETMSVLQTLQDDIANMRVNDLGTLSRKIKKESK